ncbi:hypothetical protein [Vitiosangium sp. GDMCC 1.1324]|uniref:hypothetical protein n=1 Tax=Vitiosangium sp. (strain GDMCC 1.1324) TaxID=2138576 RepID=UPI000D363959|nr:hypothetical protein [Vitiosangium sp. GDMCC 1.1324]PTL77037.1 hypothetical protein DAT35_46170 [Vitiosangium sp. GDMCC 1.1324]
MADIFSAYARPQWNVSRVLKRAGLVFLAWLVCLFLLSDITSADAPFVVMGGLVVWGLSMVGGYLFPNRWMFRIALVGALLTGTGMLAFGMGRDCFCEPSNSLVSGLRRALTGGPEPEPFSLACY